jgi:hypothetical protein
MMRGGKWMVVAGLFLLLLNSACRGDAPETGGVASGKETRALPQTGQRYYHLVGSLDDLSITMELQEEKEGQLGDVRNFRGFYRYDNYGGPIAIYGTLMDDNRLILDEQGSWAGDPHKFVGRWSDDDTYSGVWHHNDGTIVHAFRLRASNNAIPLEKYWLEDSLVSYPQWAVSPVMHYAVEWLDVAERGIGPDRRLFLRKEITKALVGKQKSTDPELLPDKIEAEREITYAEFREEMHNMRESGLIDSLADPNIFMGFNYSYLTYMQVYYNDYDLLTLGYTDYSYTGGAHGMYNTRVVAYDLANQRVLQLSDVLRPGYVEAVSKALDRAVRIKYNLGDSTPLNTFLFEDKITPNENYGFTDKGVFFVYAPYEIAPYAAGEIELFVSFEQIADYVEASWLE